MATKLALSKISITIPSELLFTIDKKRGDIARSKFIVRVLQKYMDKNGRQN